MTGHQKKADTRTEGLASASNQNDNGRVIRLGTFATEVIFSFPHSGCRLTIHAGSDANRDALTVLQEFLLTNGLVLPDAYEGWEKIQ